MGQILVDLTSVHWWFSVVIVAVLVELGAKYVGRLNDKAAGRLSTWRATRTEKLRAERAERIQKAVEHEEYRTHLRHLEMRGRVDSLFSCILSFSSFTFGLMANLHTELNHEFDQFLIVVSSLFIIMGAFSLLRTFNTRLRARQYAFEQSEVRKLLNLSSGDAAHRTADSATDSRPAKAGRGRRTQKDTPEG